jgi:hypothetical protein
MRQNTLESSTGSIPVFQMVIETAQGGFTLDETVLDAGTLLKPGTPIGYDEATRKAKVAKVATLQADAANNATTYRVTKGSPIAVGDSYNLEGGTARAITAIDTTNVAYDEITVGTTIGVAGTAGDVLYLDDDGFNKIRGLLFLPATVGDGEDISVVIRGTVYERRIPPVGATLKALLPNIIFSQSF